MAEAYIVEAVRTAGGRRNGRVAGWHPVDLAATILDSVIDRTGMDRNGPLFQRIDQGVANTVNGIEVDNLWQGDRVLGLLGHVSMGAPGDFSRKHIQPERFKNC